MTAALLSDLRLAVRTLLQRPGFALVVVLTLALGIGGNAAMFGILSATVLQPLPFAQPDRLVRIWETEPGGGGFSASEPNFLDFREQNHSFESLAAYKDVSFALLGGDRPIRVDGLAASRDFFDVLGVRPAIGREFVADEDRPGAAADVVVLSHLLWQQQFGGDRSLVGQSIELDGRAHTVIGVMPAGFEYLDAELWTPLGADPASDRDDHWLDMIGRLRPGVSIEQADADLSEISRRIGSEHPVVASWGVRLVDFPHWLVGDAFRLTAWLLFAAVGLLLLMACANLANLLLARAATRQGELGVRAALGAGRVRLARLMMVEVMLLVGVGVLAGLAVAHGAIVLLQATGTSAIPRLDEVRIDGAVLAFSVGLGLLTGLLFGLLPVLRATRIDLNRTLRNNGRSGVSAAQQRLGDGLVVGQVALALVLMVGAGLLIRSLLELRGSDPGFNPQPLLAVELQLGDRHAEPWQKVVFMSQLSATLDAIPGVAASGASITYPFSGGSFVNDVTPADRAAEAGPSGLLQARWRAVTPGFFDAVGLPLLQGRLFDGTDRWDGPRWVVISRTLAERLWPGQDASGRELYWGGVDGKPRIVAGVVGDYQDVQHGAEPEPVMFLPYNQLPWPKMTLLVRTHGEPTEVAAQVHAAIRAADPTLPVPTVKPLQQQLAQSMAGPRLRTALLAAFAAVALLLAAVGIYGVMAANVAQRRREVGLRIALGARPRTIAAMLLSRGARLALLGTALGLLGAWAVTRLLQGLLYQTAALDPAALLGGTALLATVVLAASYLPARRAARVDPMVVLRYE